MFFVFREGAGYPEGHHEECDAGEEQTGSGSSPEAIGTVRSAGPFAAEGEEVSETKSHAPEEYAVNKHWSESDAVASQCKTAHRLHGVKDVVEAPEKQERRSEIMNRRLAGIEPDNRSAEEIKHERSETAIERVRRSVRFMAISATAGQPAPKLCAISTLEAMPAESGTM